MTALLHAAWHVAVCKCLSAEIPPACCCCGVAVERLHLPYCLLQHCCNGCIYMGVSCRSRLEPALFVLLLTHELHKHRSIWAAQSSFHFSCSIQCIAIHPALPLERSAWHLCVLPQPKPQSLARTFCCGVLCSLHDSAWGFSKCMLKICHPPLVEGSLRCLVSSAVLWCGCFFG